MENPKYTKILNQKDFNKSPMSKTHRDAWGNYIKDYDEYFWYQKAYLEGELLTKFANSPTKLGLVNLSKERLEELNKAAKESKIDKSDWPTDIAQHMNLDMSKYNKEKYPDDAITEDFYKYYTDKQVDELRDCVQDVFNYSIERHSAKLLSQSKEGEPQDE